MVARPRNQINPSTQKVGRFRASRTRLPKNPWKQCGNKRALALRAHAHAGPRWRILRAVTNRGPIASRSAGMAPGSPLAAQTTVQCGYRAPRHNAISLLPNGMFSEVPTPALRVYPGSYRDSTELSDHQTVGRLTQEREAVAVQAFPVLRQAATAVEPGDGSLDDPAFGQHHKLPGV